MSVASLVWSEIIAWAERFYHEDVIVRVDNIPMIIRRSVLEDFELEIIMQLSREYCDEYHSASDPQRACPKEIFLDDVDEMANADAILEGFMSLWGTPHDTKPEIVRN